ncbi:MAG TPA: TIGR00725 family protein [Dehalococcoidia bacterium]|nr:TIGR00725 family protein [Dehalococcoidia bacterium]
MTAKKSGSDRRLIIAVIGGGQCSTEEASLAEAVGRELAKRGAILVCGGLGGIMEAACRGATIESGLTVGILPSDDPATSNPYVQISVASGVGYARNIAVVKSAQAVIAIDGDYGTLSEISYALKSGIPVIGLNTWSLSRNGQEDSSIIVAEDAVDAVEKAVSLAKGLKRH